MYVRSFWPAVRRSPGDAVAAHDDGWTRAFSSRAAHVSGDSVNWECSPASSSQAVSQRGLEGGPVSSARRHGFPVDRAANNPSAGRLQNSAPVARATAFAMRQHSVVVVEQLARMCDQALGLDVFVVDGLASSLELFISLRFCHRPLPLKLAFIRSIAQKD